MKTYRKVDTWKLTWLKCVILRHVFLSFTHFSHTVYRNVICFYHTIHESLKWVIFRWFILTWSDWLLNISYVCFTLILFTFDFLTQIFMYFHIQYFPMIHFFHNSFIVKCDYPPPHIMLFFSTINICTIFSRFFFLIIYIFPHASFIYKLDSFFDDEFIFTYNVSHDSFNFTHDSSSQLIYFYDIFATFVFMFLFPHGWGFLTWYLRFQMWFSRMVHLLYFNKASYIIHAISRD